MMLLVRDLPALEATVLARPRRPHLSSRHRSGVCSFMLLLSAGCTGGVPGDSACRNLVYKESGLSRSEYLPCAGEMIAALDVVDPKTREALEGNGRARSEGLAALNRVHALMAAAGGRRNLLERWQDQSLTEMNLTISNAVTHYEAFYMLRVLDEPHPFAAKTREAAESEYRGASRRYQEARSRYRSLR